MASERIAPFQNEVTRRFPNITVVDVTQTIETFSRVLMRLSTIIRFFAGFGVAAGVLLIVSSIIATRDARMREAVFFKVLGANRAFVTRVFFLEYVLIGALSALQAMVIAESVAWFVCTQRLDVAYRPHFLFGGLLALSTLALVTLVGLAASRSILNQKPMAALKARLQE
jgi:putative ABC transport system permease protein